MRLRLLLLLRVGILSLSLFTFIYFQSFKSRGCRGTVPDLIRWEQRSSSILFDVFIRKITKIPRQKTHELLTFFHFIWLRDVPSEIFFFFFQENCTKNESWANNTCRLKCYCPPFCVRFFWSKQTNFDNGASDTPKGTKWFRVVRPK